MKAGTPRIEITGVSELHGAEHTVIPDRIEAGTVYVNNYFNAATQSPVGGFKQSGYGRENGPYGIDEFLQTKSPQL